MTSVIEIAKCKSISKNEEMQVLCPRNRILRIQDYYRRDQNRQSKGSGNFRLAYTNEFERVTIIHRIN
jgi:hypothetical protein